LEVQVFSTAPILKFNTVTPHQLAGSIDTRKCEWTPQQVRGDNVGSVDDNMAKNLKIIL
jgi:hypothetical protein